MVCSDRISRSMWRRLLVATQSTADTCKATDWTSGSVQLLEQHSLARMMRQPNLELGIVKERAKTSCSGQRGHSANCVPFFFSVHCRKDGCCRGDIALRGRRLFSWKAKYMREDSTKSRVRFRASYTKVRMSYIRDCESILAHRSHRAVAKEPARVPEFLRAHRHVLKS